MSAPPHRPVRPPAGPPGSTPRESQLRFRAAFELAPVGQSIVGLDRCIVDVNPAYCRMLGYTRDELIGRPPEFVAHPDDAAAMNAAFERLVSGEVDQAPISKRYVRKDGTVVESPASAMLGRGPDGRPNCVVTLVQDVGEGDRRETTLRQAEGVLAGGFDNSPIGMSMVTIDGRFLRVNDAECEMLGRTAEDLVGRSIWEVTHADDTDRDRPSFDARVIGPEDHWQTEKRFVRPDGSVVWGLVNATLLRDDTGRPICYFSQMLDLTERKKAEEALRASEERHRSVVDHVKEIIFQTDATGRLGFLNPAWTAITGDAVADSLGSPLLDHVHPDDRSANAAFLRELASGERARWQQDLRLRSRDGGWRWVELDARVIIETNGGLCVSGSMDDVTDRERARSQARLLQELTLAVGEAEDLGAALAVVLKRVCETTGWALGQAWVPDDHGANLVCSPAWYGVDDPRVGRFRAYSERLVLGPGQGIPGRVSESRQPFWSFNAPSATTSIRGALATDTGMAWGMGIPVLADDELVAVIEFFHFEPGDEEDMRMMDLVSTVATQLAALMQRKRAEDELAHRALHDPLTGLPNRQLFLDRLEQALARVERVGGHVTVLFFDLDRFKVVNDSLGHSIGDQVLVATAEAVATALRPSDTVCRLGGDEFAVLCEELAGPEQAGVVAERVAQAVARVVSVAGRDLFLTASIGIAMATSRCEPEMLLRNADAAMYRAKERGRARCEVFDEAMQARLVNRLETEGALRQALERDELRVHYQPTMSLASGRVVGVEALVRWHHPERGIVVPDDFISLAEETGLIVPIGTWVLQEACRQAVRWRERGAEMTNLSVSVNLSARQLAEADLPFVVTEALGASGLPADSLYLEITESVLVDDELTTGTLDALRRLGVRISVDDFGTGYSSLVYLRRFSVDVLKIDRSFVAGLGHDTEDGAIVEAVVQLAHTLGLSITAEGVETAEQLAQLRALGCEMAQGFFWSRPLPADDLERWIDQRRVDVAVASLT